MASKKRGIKRSKTDTGLSPEAPRELEIILDRLLVQSPEGESLKNYLQSLGRALAGRDNLIAALLEKLSRDPSEVGFQAFVALSTLVQDKQYRRVIKQAAYRFAQRGYGAESQTPPEQKVVLIPKETRRPIAHLTCTTETFWLVSALVPESASSTYSSPVAISVYPEEEFQRLTVRITEGSQRVYREFIQRIGSELSQKPIEIPMWHAAGLFFELIEFCGKRGDTSEIERARQVLQPFHDPGKLPYAFEFMPVVDSPKTRLGEVDIKALIEAVVSDWIFPPRIELQPYREKMAEIGHSLLVVSPEVQQERVADVIRKAADDLIVANTRLLCQRFFEEHALAMKLSSKDDLAMYAWIVAQHLRSGALPSENPVLRELIVISMKTYWPEEFEEKKESEEPAPFQYTQSGLILPR